MLKPRVIAHLMIVAACTGRLFGQAPAPSSETGDAVLFAYGHSQPTVVCAPLRACAIELEPGERVLATALGDTERWLVDQAITGAHTPLIIVKPTACDIATNVVISTDRRVYDLALESPVCAAHRVVAYTRRVRFTYPGGSVVSGAAVASSAEFHPESLAFTYRWMADRKISWSPIAVYDDGTHVYVRLPESAKRDDLPVLLQERDDKTTSLLPYIVANNTYVTDRIFTRAILRAGSKQIEIVNAR
jgi:P-type conjugative transfer protein TrbG